MVDIQFSKEVAEMAIEGQFEGTKIGGFIHTIYYYVVDSKFRRKVRLNKFLSDQLENPDPELIRAANTCTGLDTDETIINVIKFVLDRMKYKTDFDNWGKNEYWATAIETYNKKYDDCFPGFETIIVKNKQTGNISVKSFDDLKDTYHNFLALSYNKNSTSTQLEFKPILNFIEKGVKAICKVQLRNGSFCCTPSHKFLLQCEKDNKFNWTKLEDMPIESKKYYARNLLAIRKVPHGQNILSKHTSRVIAAYIADGWRHKDKICIAGDNIEIRRKLHKSLDALGIKYSQSKRKTHAYTTILKKQTPRNYLKLLESLGSKGKYKCIPESIFSANKNSLLHFLECYAERDGTWKKGKLVGLSTVSNKLAEQLKLLLKMCGIDHSHYISNHQYSDCNRQPINRIEIKELSTSVINYDLRKNSIKSITYAGETKVYDITIKDNHNFILSNGIIAHNCDGINGLIYVLARLAGIPRWLIYSVIGDVASGGHYWCVYWSPKYDKLVVIDGTYYPSSIGVKNRPNFNLMDNYKSIWYIFNDKWVFRPDKIKNGNNI